MLMFILGYQIGKTSLLMRLALTRATQKRGRILWVLSFPASSSSSRETAIIRSKLTPTFQLQGTGLSIMLKRCPVHWMTHIFSLQKWLLGNVQGLQRIFSCQQFIVKPQHELPSTLVENNPECGDNRSCPCQ